MIEIIQENSKTEENLEGKLPKNIRQIGNPEKDFRIYMEDYVYTYLHPAKIQEGVHQETPRLLILLGEIEHLSNRSCAFISGAIQIPSHQLLQGELELEEEVWQTVRMEIRQYFAKSEIIGWVYDLAGSSFEITVEIENLHRKHFAGKFQFLFLMDSVEREEAFYMWKQGQLAKKDGYFIYYEKNPQMQEYMICQREAEQGEIPQKEEVDDKAAQNYRAMMLERKEQVVKTHWGFGTYATYGLLILSLCTVSVVLLGSIKKVDNMESAISKLSVSMESTERKQGNQKKQVTVETISGNVQPIAPSQEEVGQETDVGQGSNEEPLPVAQSPEAEQPPVEEQPPVTEQPQEAEQAPVEEQKSTPETTTPPETNQAENKEDPDATEPQKTDVELWRQQGYYIVQAGDSLRQICYKIYQTYAMMEKLCEVNGISDENTILAGQKLILP